MKNNIFKLGLGAVMASACLLFSSCENFLNRPGEDSYNAGNYYCSDEACINGVNYLYNSPWYDFQRGFIKVGEVFSGNMYWGSSPYLNFSVNGTDADLINMSYSLWAEISHCSTVYNNIEKATGTSDAVRNQCMGECLAWKAMAYFYLVRSFGEVPIIHNNSAELGKGEYNTYKKHSKADVYEYIILTLEKSMELLPKHNSQAGRIDYYCAEALLAKVYLTKAGLSGSLNEDDLLKAASLSKDVIENSGRVLTAKYSDIFRGSHNNDDESLFAWRWTVGSHWTCQNTLQSDLAPDGFGDQGDLWGGWGGPSVDLMNAFGVIEMNRITPDSAVIKTFKEPKANTDAFADARCAATMMFPGIEYDYFWRNKSPKFDILNFYYNKDYNSAASEEFQGPCGCQNVKHLYGNDADHTAEMGFAPTRMAYAFATHILRLGDLYLVNAEANLLAAGGDKAYGQARFDDVRKRAGVAPVAYTFDNLWKERRLELAGEGDRWYDYVRRAYYDADACLAELKTQFRNNIWGCAKFYKEYYNGGKGTKWDNDLKYQGDKKQETVSYNNELAVPHNIDKSVFTLPFPSEDVSLNPNLGRDAEVEDFGAAVIRETFNY